MPIIRNPFRKQDENLRPPTANGLEKNESKSSEAININEKKSAEYKLSGK